MECKEYVDKKIKEQTTYIDAKSFIEGAKSLKKMWAVIWLAVTVAFVLNIVYGMLALIILGIIVPQLVRTVLVLQGNARKHTYDEKINVNIDDLCTFLKDNLNELPFTEWSRGVSSLFGIKVENLELIECCFKGKTYHRILFDKTERGIYRIQVSNVSTKEKLKRMNHGGSLAYKHYYVVEPILDAALECYFSKERDGLQNNEKTE